MKFAMDVRRLAVVLALMIGLQGAVFGAPGTDDQQVTTVVGTVRDEQNAIALPGVTVEVVGSNLFAVTDVDGRYQLRLRPGSHELKVAMDGYQARTVRLAVGTERTLEVDVPLTMARFAEEVTVTAEFLEADTSSAAVQLIERKNAQVITNNIGAQEMRANGDSDAASAMQRVTGLSLVDNQYVFVRGLGERYSNTTLAGSVIPTTEPDKKVVPLDLFPTGLVDSVQVAKSYSPDKSAEFAGGLVQIVPLKFPNRPMLDLSYGTSYSSTATGQDILLSPLGSRDFLGYDDGARAMPGAFPDSKIVRRGIYTPNVGYSPTEITDFGRLLENRWTPDLTNGDPGQNWGVVFGQRFGKVGVVASLTQSYKESYVEEQRRFYRVASGGRLEPVSDYAMKYGTQKAQLGAVANIAYQFSPNHRVTSENFYTHSGRDEGRFFEGPNTENNLQYRNYRLMFVEEGLLNNAVSGEHFFPGLKNSRVDWRASYGQATRDEPDLREMLYQAPLTGGTFLAADESQSGFRMFNELSDDSLDVAGNWSIFGGLAGRPAMYKVGVSYVDRSRDFQSRRFRFIPTTTSTGGSVPINLALPPEDLFAPSNIGSVYRFNEETRPVDAYAGDQSTTSIYGMTDWALSARARLVAGARVEAFKQDVVTFDPFGLFQGTITASLDNTDVFPGINFVYSFGANMNVRTGYSATVNRPEFRELAEFEFTDVVGSRAIRGNPDLQRALIQNVDARWEMFGGSRGLLSASGFYKHFDKPIERVVLAGAQPIATFQNAESARNYGLEFEAAREFFRDLYFSLNYTYVSSEVTLSPEQRTVQTSQQRPLAGQSNNLVNFIGEYTLGGFQARALFNYFDDRISDVGANDAPDVVEKGRGSLDVVFSQRLWDRFTVRLNLENLTDSEYLFVQGAEDQRVYKLGRTIAVSFGYNVF